MSYIKTTRRVTEVTDLSVFNHPDGLSIGQQLDKMVMGCLEGKTKPFEAVTLKISGGDWRTMMNEFHAGTKESTKSGKVVR